MLNNPAWKNGEYCKVQDLNISILDLGLIHCDATYDVIAVKDGEIQNLDAHLNRFVKSCYGWRIPLKYSNEELTTVFNKLVSLSENKNLLLWVGITRGIPSSGNPRDLINCSPNIFAYVKPYFGFNLNNEATACISKQIRNDSFDQKMKNFCWNDLTLAQWEAIDRGFDTAILLSRDGYITEGPGFNIGFIKGDSVFAPATNRLQGTTMDLVKDLCLANNKEFLYCDITPDDAVDNMDAAFLTSTAGNVITLSRLHTRFYKPNEFLKWLQQNI